MNTHERKALIAAKLGEQIAAIVPQVATFSDQLATDMLDGVGDVDTGLWGVMAPLIDAVQIDEWLDKILWKYMGRALNLEAKNSIRADLGRIMAENGMTTEAKRPESRRHSTTLDFGGLNNEPTEEM